VLKRRARAWRGDWIGLRRGNLVPLPIARADTQLQDTIVAAYERCRGAADALDDAVTDADTETLSRIYDAAVLAFDRLVFDLYEISDEELQVIRSA
jgi:hypothetical protein